MLLAPYVCFPPIGKIAAHSAYDMFSWYGCLIVDFPTSVFGVGIFFLIAPFHDLCLIVPFCPAGTSFLWKHDDHCLAMYKYLTAENI